MKDSESVIKVEWDLDTDCPELIGNPTVLQYDYDLPEDEISILDFVPTSVLTADLKFEELTCSSALQLEQQEVQVKTEVIEPCAAAVAIEANIPTPHPSALSKWRTFISAAYYHPNILVHVDVAELKELFELLGSDIHFESINVMIDLGKSVKEYKPVPYLRPTLPSNHKPPLFNFAHVKDFFIDMELKVCIVTKYAINDSMKKAVNEMVTFIVEYPELLYLEIYGFILDFLLKFGVQSEMVIDAVMRTQTRRRKCQYPASVLILKKASKLGKGRKEFLQKRLLETPEQKYHPVVPIISEPTPVRNLRNRRTGGTDLNRTPAVFGLPVPQASSTSSLNRNQNNTTAEIGKPHVASSNGLVFAVKRRLFVEEDAQVETKCRINNTSDFSTSSSKKDCSSTIARSIAATKRKRFYSRRDSSTIEKPFACSICPGRSFAYKGNLVLHMKKKHSSNSAAKGKPKRQENIIPAFTCPVCLQGYASKYRCKTHMDRHHPEHVDWDPISNEECMPKPKKTVFKGQRKCSGSRMSKETVRRNTRKSLVPLSDTQNSSPEKEKLSHFCLSSKPDYYSSNSFKPSKQQLNIHISNKRIPVAYKEPPFSNLSHIRTRQQFRAAVK